MEHDGDNLLVPHEVGEQDEEEQRHAVGVAGRVGPDRQLVVNRTQKRGYNDVPALFEYIR